MTETLSPPNGPADREPANERARRERVGDRVTLYRTDASPFWYMDYSVDGRQYRPSTRTRSLKQARLIAKRKDAELLLGTGGAPAVRAPKIHEAIEDYLAAKGGDRKPGTLKTYRCELEDIAAYAVSQGLTRIDQMNAAFLYKYAKHLQEHGMEGIVHRRKRGCKPKPNKASTTRGKLRTFRQLVNWLLGNGLLANDFLKGFRVPRRKKQQAYCWSPAELRLIREHIHPGYLDLIDFLRLTGLRSDEFCWLMKEDVDFERPHVKIREKTCGQSGRAWEPKHGNERVVPLCAEALAIARKAWEASPGPWLFYAPDTRGTQPGHFTPSRLLRALNIAKKKAGVARGTTHTFRHVFCSFMANNGVSPFKVMRIMGHTSLEIVLIYYHLSDDELLGALSDISFAGMLVDLMPARRGDVPETIAELCMT